MLRGYFFSIVAALIFFSCTEYCICNTKESNSNDFSVKSYQDFLMVLRNDATLKNKYILKRENVTGALLKDLKNVKRDTVFFEKGFYPMDMNFLGIKNKVLIFDSVIIGGQLIMNKDKLTSNVEDNIVVLGNLTVLDRVYLKGVETCFSIILR